MKIENDEGTTWGRLEAFAREELGRPLFGARLNLQPASRLEEDLGLTGLDADKSIDKWVETSSVQPQGVQYRRYFSPEVNHWYRRSLGQFAKRFRRQELVPLTLGPLVESLRRGRWDTAEIEGCPMRAVADRDQRRPPPAVQSQSARIHA